MSVIRMSGFGMKERLLNTAIVVVGLSAVTNTSVAAYRVLRPADSSNQVTMRRDWKTFSQHGHRMGPATAPVTIIEFSDFECPACKAAAKTLRDLRLRYPETIAVIYRHFPLEQTHRLAFDAAVASECAAQQGAFERYHDALFAQDALNGAWTRLAQKSGVTDTVRFNECLSSADARTSVIRDIAHAAKLKATGTPTVLVNEYQLKTGARAQLLDSLILLVLEPRK